MKFQEAGNMRLRWRQDGTLWVPTGDYGKQWLGTPSPEIEQTRRYFGPRITPQVIEEVLLMATYGHMRDLTDLVYECLAIYPHFSAVTGKRLRALLTQAPTVEVAKGDGIDPAKAELYADIIRAQLDYLPLRKPLLQLNWGHCFGRAAAEKIWGEAPKGSRIRWRIERVNWIHPRRLCFGPERELRVRDDAWSGVGFEARGIELRAYPHKFFQFLPQLFNDYPEREGFGPRGLFWTFFQRFTHRERLALMEIFGRPWRNVYTEDAAVQKELLEEAARNVDQMSANATGALPPGVKLDTSMPPGQNQGQIHADIVQYSDDQVSKLVLGETRTSDAKPSALGSASDAIAKDVSDEVKDEDGANLSDLLTEQLSCDVIALNFGPDEISHAPRIVVKYTPPVDRDKEVERATKLISFGIPLKLSEVYERTGYTEPGPDDEVIVQAPAPGLPGLPGLAGLPALPASDDEPGLNPEPDPAQLGGAHGDPLALARSARVLALISTLSDSSTPASTPEPGTGTTSASRPSRKVRTVRRMR